MYSWQLEIKFRICLIVLEIFGSLFYNEKNGSPHHVPIDVGDKC